MRMRTLLFTTPCAVAIIASGVASARADEPALTGDLAKLQGQWTAMFGPQQNIPLVITVKGTAVTLTIANPEGREIESKGEIKINDKVQPNKTIDWVKFAKPNGEAAPTNRGIYMLEGDSVTICNGGPGNERPTEFKAGEGGAPQLIVLTRKTAATATATAAAGDLTGDQAKIQGRWSAKVGPQKNVSIVLTIQGTNATLSIGGPNGERESKGEIRIDETAKPHKTFDWVNFTAANGQRAPGPNLAIYKLNGGTLTICSGGQGNERPTEFKAGPENRNPSLIVLNRE